MTCDDCRRELSVRSTRDFGDLAHLAHCAACATLARRITEQEAALHATLGAWVDAAPPVPARGDSGRWLPAAAILAAAVGALWLALAGGPGAPGPEPPATPAAPAPVRPDLLDLAAGRSVVLTLPRPLAAFEALDPEIVRVEVLDEEDRKLHVVGLAEGRTELHLAFLGTERTMVYAIEVAPAPVRASPESTDVVKLQVGASATVPARTVPEAVAVSDPARADASAEPDGIRIEALAPGVTDVVVTYAEEPPDIWIVEIAP